MLRRWMAALLVCLMMAGGAAAEADWYERQAEALARRMVAIATDEAYMTVFINSEDILSEIRRAAENAEHTPQIAARYRFQAEALDTLLAEATGGEASSLTPEGRRELERRTPLTFANMLNGRISSVWLAATSVAALSETHAMPEGFAPCALRLSYGTEIDVLVVFAATGDDTVTASAAFIQAEGMEAGLPPFWAEE